MAGKKGKTAKGVAVVLDNFHLRCEWGACEDTFQNMSDFINHVTRHLTLYYQREDALRDGSFVCQWRDCNSHIYGKNTDFNRHVYFHAFHVKIKNVGAAVVEKVKITPCQLDNGSRNLIPELPERLHCGWNMCEMVYDNPEYFYQHMDMHAVNFPDGNFVPGGCKCEWEGCETVVKSKYRIREHLRSHTQEKMIACPVCGALFYNRTKFLDHLKRQESAEVQCYECSHCNKRFSSERLLRDHMRHHVNHYKCPCCDMTCPTPSALRNHLRYRHTNHRPYKCDLCDYCSKSNYDLRKHMESHSMVKTFQCHVAGCEFRVRSYQSLSHHFTKEHQGLEAARHACHVCDNVFVRGHQLTKHLKNCHKFKWPSGHSRFRYKPHEDGFLRLQTVRYESVELMDQIEDVQTPTEDVNQSEQNQENVAPILSKTTSPPTSSDIVKCAESDSGLSVESSPAENMAYNLEMLGEVALQRPIPSASEPIRKTRSGGKRKRPCKETAKQNDDKLDNLVPPAGNATVPNLQLAVNQSLQNFVLDSTLINPVLLQGSCVTGENIGNVVNITEQNENGEMVTRQVISLNNMNQSSFLPPDTGVFNQDYNQAISSQLVTGLNENLAEGYVVCSSDIDFPARQTQNEGSGGAEMDILKLQQYGSAL